MKRIQVYYTDQQLEALERLAKETGLTVSEILRRALDAYLARQRKPDESESSSA